MNSESVKDFYTGEGYIEKNPDLHEADSPWKISVLLPFVDEFAKQHRGDVVSILDVGGGAGVILRELSRYLANRHGKSVKKYALDLSPGMLEVQKKNNPDMIETYARDIAHTGLADTSIDLVLMIDVLEHVTDVEQVLVEIRRIARYSIFKVPLEDTLYYHAMDVVTRGAFRKRIIAQIGHINVFSAESLRGVLRQQLGQIQKERFANAYDYLLTTKQTVFNRLFNMLGALVYRLSPSLAARLFNDYLVMLVKHEAATHK